MHIVSAETIQIKFSDPLQSRDNVPSILLDAELICTFAYTTDSLQRRIKKDGGRKVV
jgi:hypothetical protein